MTTLTINFRPNKKSGTEERAFTCSTDKLSISDFQSLPSFARFWELTIASILRSYISDKYPECKTAESMASLSSRITITADLLTSYQTEVRARAESAEKEPRLTLAEFAALTTTLPNFAEKLATSLGMASSASQAVLASFSYFLTGKDTKNSYISIPLPKLLEVWSSRLPALTTLLSSFTAKDENAAGEIILIVLNQRIRYLLDLLNEQSEAELLI